MQGGWDHRDEASVRAANEPGRQARHDVVIAESTATGDVAQDAALPFARIPKSARQ
jgi:hypothetical protein